MACDMTKLVNFSDEKKQLIATCIDNYTGELSNFVAANVNTDSRSIDNEIRSRFENEIFHGEKYNYRTYRKYKNEIFEILETVLDQTLPEGWNDNEFMNEFVDIIRVDLGDKNEFYAEDSGLLTVSKFSGNHWDTARERVDVGQKYSVDTEWWEVHFYNDFERFIKNIDSFSKMLDKARKSFLQAFQAAIYAAFVDMGDYVPNEFVGNGTLTSASDKQNFLNLVERVSVANNGINPILVGTRTALRQLQATVEDSWIASSAKEERKANGVVKDFEGYQLMCIPQVFQKGTFNFALSNTRILVIASAEKPIKFVYEGESRMKEVTDNRENMDQTLEGQIQTKAGVAVMCSGIFGDWELA